jgi:hypothetical protein
MQFDPPQVNYRDDPSHGQSDLGMDHPTRDDPNCGGTVYGPQADASFHSYDTIGDAEAFNQLSPSAPVPGSLGVHA